MALLTGLITGVAAVLLLPTVSDVISFVWIALGRRLPTGSLSAQGARLLFLVPAHDEELLIDACVRSLLYQRDHHGQVDVVVIADNCTDHTATLARAAGARCLVRDDRARPGKPHAIAWALERLSIAATDAVVIIDADTIVAPDFAAHLMASGPLRSKAMQAFFDVSNPDESPLTRMAAVLATAMHRLAYPLKQRAGLNVPLVGNGMLFGSDILVRHGWHAFSICEDWEMYALLSEQGIPIQSVPAARLYAQEARSLRQSSSQRQRWTAGKLTVLTRIGPRLLATKRIGVRQKLDACAELAAPGPALHLGLVGALGAVCLLLRGPGSVLAIVALIASLLRPLTYAAVALTMQPQPRRALTAFAFLPVYTVWRIGTAVLALRMLGNKPWIRTQRHQHTPV